MDGYHFGLRVMFNRHGALVFCLTGMVAGGASMFASQAQQPAAGAPAPSPAHRDVIGRYCMSCHNDRLKTGGLCARHGRVERGRPKIRKCGRKCCGRCAPARCRRSACRGRTTPPTRRRSCRWSSRSTARPPPARILGRTDTLRRLNRTEYRNAIRDLLALDVDVTPLLPADEASYGFDNVTVGDLRRHCWTATSRRRRRSAGWRSDVPAVLQAAIRSGFQPDLTQEEHVDGLPLGTRGGAVVRYTFPLDAEYEIQIRLARDRNEHVEGLTEPHEVELLLDGERVQMFTVKPPLERQALRRLSALP